MHMLEPVDRLIGYSFSTRVIVKAFADVLVTTVLLAAKNHIRRRAHNSVQFLILADEFHVQLQQQFRFASQFFGTLQHTQLQIPIQSFELPRLAVQVGKYSYLRAQHFWNNGNRNIIDGSMFVPLSWSRSVKCTADTKMIAVL